MRPSKPPKRQTLARCPVYGKVQHRTENGAKAHALRLTCSRGFDGTPALPYVCPGCGQWHVGRQAQNVTQYVRAERNAERNAHTSKPRY